MSTRLLAGIGAAVTVVLLACGGLLGGIIGGVAATCTAILTPDASTSAGGLGTPPPGGYAAIGRWDSEQVGNAAVIISVGARLGVPAQGWIIAVATAMQESTLHNQPDGNQDSLGLFQQRPSQGWGTPAQIMDPVYASTQFLQHLLHVPNWQDLPLTVAAQRVQRSTYPDAYAKWEADATRIVATLTGTGDPAVLAAGCDPADTAALPSDFSLPPGTPPAVVTAIAWALAQLGTPYSFGGDCTNPHGTDPAHQCDCSSLMQQAYKTAGVSLPRTAAQQFHAGTPVPDPSYLQPGDLVFVPGALGSTQAPGHVGMYLGNGLVIDAPPPGQVVHIMSLQPYWTGHLAGIRRIA
jgi:cell wall-associated NlpC family hydrolase